MSHSLWKRIWINFDAQQRWILNFTCCEKVLWFEAVLKMFCVAVFEVSWWVKNGKFWFEINSEFSVFYLSIHLLLPQWPPKWLHRWFLKLVVIKEFLTMFQIQCKSLLGIKIIQICYSDKCDSTLRLHSLENNKSGTHRKCVMTQDLL